MCVLFLRFRNTHQNKLEDAERTDKRLHTLRLAGLMDDGRPTVRDPRRRYGGGAGVDKMASAPFLLKIQTEIEGNQPTDRFKAPTWIFSPLRCAIIWMVFRHQNWISGRNIHMNSIIQLNYSKQEQVKLLYSEGNCNVTDTTNLFTIHEHTSKVSNAYNEKSNVKSRSISLPLFIASFSI